MRHIHILCAAAALAAIVSCTKESGIDYTVEESSMTPRITMGENNIKVLDESNGPGWYTFPVSANVTAYTASYDNTSMRGISLHDIHGGDDQYGIPESVKLGFGSRDGYTCDATFLLIQPPYNQVQTKYTSYGLVETMLNFRIIGTDGTFYLDAAETNQNSPTHLNKCVNSYRYLLGTVKSFGEIYEENRSYLQIDNSPLQGSWSSGYTAEILPVVIESSGVELTLLIVGKKRDGDIARFLDYVSVGDTIETRLPATAYDKNDPKVLKDIYTCYVLKF